MWIKLIFRNKWNSIVQRSFISVMKKYLCYKVTIWKLMSLSRNGCASTSPFGITLLLVLVRTIIRISPNLGCSVDKLAVPWNRFKLCVLRTSENHILSLVSSSNSPCIRNSFYLYINKIRLLLLGDTSLKFCELYISQVATIIKLVERSWLLTSISI